MSFIKKYLFLASIVLLVQSCKNDQPTTTQPNVVASPNDSKAFENTGAKDVSGQFTLKQNQKLGDESMAFNFKSQNTFRIYCKTDDPQNQIIFAENEVFAIFADTSLVKTNFKVEGIDLVGDNTLLSISTVPTTSPMNKHRPSFIATIPKKDIKGYPVVKLDGKQIPVTVME